MLLEWFGFCEVVTQKGRGNRAYLEILYGYSFKKKKYSMDKIVYHAKPLETEQPDHVHGMKYSAACWCY
jgi:hypothetical protein